MGLLQVMLRQQRSITGLIERVNAAHEGSQAAIARLTGSPGPGMPGPAMQRYEQQEEAERGFMHHDRQAGAGRACVGEPTREQTSRACITILLEPTAPGKQSSSVATCSSR